MRSIYFKQITGLSLASVTLSRFLSFCDSSSDVENHSFCLYLNKDSQKSVKEFLKSVGLHNYEGDNVVIKRSLIHDDSYVYETLYGKRAAFRLKGMIKTENGLTGIGKVSIMSGELVDPAYSTSFPLHRSDSEKGTAHDIEITDMPTRLFRTNFAKDKPQWQGKIPSGNVLNKNYTSTKASLISYSFSKQIVVDGILCSSEFIDSEGNCTFDINNLIKKEMTESSPIIKEVVPDANSVMNPNEESTAVTNSEDEIQSSDECPLCRYMKAGPCKEQYLLWDNCIRDLNDDEDLSKCFEKTVQFMSCMKQYEYYDIFTSNTANTSSDTAVEEGSGGTAVEQPVASP